MCFSATASFAVGGSLILLGAVTLKRAAGRQRREQLPFASIPLLFGIQQLVEGALWLSIEHDGELLRTIATYLFTLFSHIIWPLFVPYAVARMERGRPVATWRRNAMWGCRLAGVVTAMLLLALVASQPLTAVADEHIIYTTPFFYDWPMMVLYIVATCIVTFFSTFRLVRLFGLLVLLFFFVSYWFYTAAFFSVWCFFAAILSLVIYLQFRGGSPAGGGNR